MSASTCSVEWLALREPADAQARSALTLRAAAWRRRLGTLSVVDLGTGTGSNLRFLAPRLGGRQEWCLVDHDAKLLARVEPPPDSRAEAGTRPLEHSPEIGRLGRSAGDVGLHGSAALDALHLSPETRGVALSPEIGRLELGLETRRLDLAGELDSLDLAPFDLVTASALIDLVSRTWLETLAQRCAEARAAVLIALTYDGEIDWEPALDADGLVRSCVNFHQTSDRGFGPALGPKAAPAFGEMLDRLGYRVELERSPWRLDDNQRAVQEALLECWIEATREVCRAGLPRLGSAECADRRGALGEAPRDAPRSSLDWLERWAEMRRDHLARGHSRLSVGHLDLWAEPR